VTETVTAEVDVLTILNRGFAYLMVEKYQKAVADFDKGITLDAGFPYAHANGGLAKIKLGQEAEGLADIAQSLALEVENGYANKSLGVYNYDKREFDQARVLFQNAKKFEKKTHLIDDWIERTKKKIGA
jgi:tetratricopeptide (TPR) repeat protein